MLSATAPTGSAPSSVNGQENTPLIFSAAHNNAIVLNDPSAGLNADTMSLSVTNGTLQLATSAGLTFTTGAASGSSSLVFSGSTASINNALNGMGFVPNASFHSRSTLHVGVTDPSDGLSNSWNISISIQQENIPPTVGIPLPQTLKSNTPLIFSSSNGNAISVNDADSQGGSEKVTLVATKGMLTLGSTSGVNIQTSGPTTWVFDGPISSLQNALNGLKFTPQTSYTGEASIQITINDQSNTGNPAKSATAMLPMTIATTAQPPVANVPSAQTTAQNTPVVFSIAAGNPIWISNVGNTGGPEQVTLSGSLGKISLAATAGLTFTSGTGSGDSSVTFTGTLANINAALNGLTYTPNSQATGTDSLQVQVNDLGNTVTGSPQTGANSVGITITNAAPTVAIAAAASPGFVTGTSTILSVLGADDGGESNLTYTWSVSGLLIGPVTFSTNGTNSAKDVVATFSRTGIYNFAVTITDAGGKSTSSSISVTVLQLLPPGNTTPVITVPNAQQAIQNTPVIFSTAAGNVISITNSQNGNENITLTATNGLLTLSSFSGLNFSVGTGIGNATMTFQGTPSEVNTAINGLTFTPSLGFFGSPNVQVLANVGGGNAAVSNIPITVAQINLPPTVATAASATPNPASGTSAALSVLGADDHGESNLTYSWSVISKPTGALNPSFSLNGANVAKNTTATFSDAGMYTLEVTITDDGGLSTTSTVNLQINQTLTSISVSPANSALVISSMQQFSSIGFDQFGQNMLTQPAFTWSANAGSINFAGLYTAPMTASSAMVTAASGAVSGSTGVTIVGSNTAVASPSIVTGLSTTLSVIGGATSGVTYTWSILSKPSGALDPTYSANASGAAQTTTATFQQAGGYTFQVLIDNGSSPTTQSVSVTVVQTLGGIVVMPTSTSLNQNGQTQFSAVSNDQFGNPMATQPALAWTVQSGVGAVDDDGLFTAPGSGMTGSAIIAAAFGSTIGTATVTVSNAAPTVAIAAAAAPSTVTGVSTNLSVLGADDGGESNLIYNWTLVGTPPGPVIFSAHNSNDAKNVTATFAQGGAYNFLVTITDAGGASTTSTLAVQVVPTLSSITVTPTTGAIERGSSLQFSATAHDQFGAVLVTQPIFTWSVNGNVGSIDASGLYTSPTAGNGAATIVVTSGTASGIAYLTLIDDLSVAVPATQSVNSGDSVHFAGANVISISDGDPNTASVLVSLTLVATDGTIGLSGEAGLTFSTGTGSNDTTVTFTGDLADLNSALSGMVFNPVAGFASAPSLAVTINEVGNGPSPTQTIAIHVNSAAPTVIPSSGTIAAAPSNSESASSSGSQLAGILNGNSSNTGIENILSAPSSEPYTSNTALTNVAFSDVIIGSETSSADQGTPAAPAQAQTVNVNPPPQNSSPPAVEQAPAILPKPTVAANVKAAVNPTPSGPGAVPDRRVQTVPDQVFPFLARQSPMSKEMDIVEKEMTSEAKLKMAAGSATVVSFGASAAYFIWLLRGGSLLSSLLSVLPAWKSIDPLPVLEALESKKRRKTRMDSDLESLESLVDKSNSAPQDSESSAADYFEKTRKKTS
jgi:hypothetical protein